MTQTRDTVGRFPQCRALSTSDATTDAAQRYSRTPITAPEDVPRGSYMHIGGGQWLRRCRGCDDFIVTSGTIEFVLEFAQHEHNEHSLDVVGYNVAMLR